MKQEVDESTEDVLRGNVVMVSRYEQFSFVISGISRYIQKIEREEMVKFGCKGAYAQYLMAMNRHPEGLTAVQLSEICDRDKAAISRVIAEMEEKGLVIREDQQYRAKLKLTGKGLQAAEFVRVRAENAVEAVSRGVSDEERRILYSALDVIAANLETLCKEGIPE